MSWRDLSYLHLGINPGDWGWFKACLRPRPSSLHEAQPTVSRAASMSFLRRSDELARKMVGWTPYKIVGPSISREVELATTPGDRPTHPTIPNRPVRIAANGNKSRQKRISGLVLNLAAWIPGLRYMFQLGISRKRRNPAVLSTPGVHTAPPGMTSAGTIVLESGRRYNQAPAPLS